MTIAVPNTASRPAATPGSFKEMLLKRPGVARLLVFIGMIVLWEISGHTILDPHFLSPPSAIIQAMPHLH